MASAPRLTGLTVGLCTVALGALVTAAPASAEPGGPEGTTQPTLPTQTTTPSSSTPGSPFAPFTPVEGPRSVAEARARIAQLEANSAAAASRALASSEQLAASRQRLELFNRHVESVRQELAVEQRTLAGMARELYLNGGVPDSMLTFALEDADAFIADLDRLVVTGTRQNTVLERARARAVSLKITQLAQAREEQRLRDATTAVVADQAAADKALAEARAVLAELVAAEERKVAEAQARAALDEAIRQAEAVAEEWRRVAAAAATTAAQTSQSLAAGAQAAESPNPGGAPSPTPATATTGTTGAALTEDLSQYGDSASWAESAKSLAVKMCESGNNYSTNTGNGYYGAWQFDYPSWHDNGGGMFAEYPHQATKAQQDYIAWTYWRKAGWRPWECG